jgi:hypothetical protein
MNAETLREAGDLVGIGVRRVGQLIESYPRRPGRDAGISRKQMLVKVLGARADHGDVHPLGTFGL